MKVYAKIRQNGEYHSQNISQAVGNVQSMAAACERIFEFFDEKDLITFNAINDLFTINHQRDILPIRYYPTILGR